MVDGQFNDVQVILQQAMIFCLTFSNAEVDTKCVTLTLRETLKI